MGTSLNSNAQNSYFFNQKNLFSLHVSMNPRLMPMKQDNKYVDPYSSPDGIGRGTFYQYYNDDNELIGGNEKVNLMLNVSYGRLFGGRHLVGAEFNYQKHYLTMSEDSNIGYPVGEPYGENPIPLLISTPVFNVYDLQVFYGYFISGSMSPNKHLFTYGGGIRMFSLDKNQNYRKNAGTPFTDLSQFVGGYDRSFIYARVTINYTYRIFLTKNLCLDLGINTNIGLYLDMDYGEGYQIGNKVAYNRNYIRAKLGAETALNVFYFRTGLSFAI